VAYIHWTVSVPQLDNFQEVLLMLGAQIMDALQGIRDEIVRLNTGQQSGADAIAAMLQAIATEVSQFVPGTVSQADLDGLAANVRDAANLAEAQAQMVRDAATQIATIIPDAPPGP
jgi:hypothetical protein